MGLRCSLLGHAFGEPVTERERETRGAEVLITVREVRRCSRCDAEQVISENKEIRHLGSEGEASPDKPSTQPSREATGGPATGADRSMDDSDASEGESPAEAALESPAETGERESEPVTAPGKAGSDEQDTPETDAVGAESDEEEDTEVDVSELVDPAEGPDAGGPGREPPVGRTDDQDHEPPQDEDVEIIDGDTETDSRDSETDGDEEREGGDEDQTETVEEPESPETAVDEPSSDPSPEPDESSHEATPTGDQPAEGRDADEPEADTTLEESGPPDDDAIILDNDTGKDARESDVGRREIAGSGNMFEPSAPEDEGGREPAPGESEIEGTESDAEKWPGREVEGRDEGRDEEATETGSTEPTDWPTSESVDESSASDSSFQFGEDMLADEDETPSKTPSGLTSEGSIDVAGDPDESSPKTVECPECGHTAEGVGSSLRAGDICPACHDAYLTYRR